MSETEHSIKDKINEAIHNNQDVIKMHLDKSIESKIDSVKGKIESEIDTVKESITSLEKNVQDIKDEMKDCMSSLKEEIMNSLYEFKNDAKLDNQIEML